jgi:hypothetical protein
VNDAVKQTRESKMKIDFGWKRIALWVLVVGTMTGGGLVLTAEETTSCFGHSIPPFKGVFIKLFKVTAALMSLEQMRATAAPLSDAERAAVHNYLGEEGRKQIREGLPQAKQNFLDQQYAAKSGITPAEIKAVYPHLLALSNSNLSPEQLQKTLDALTPEEIASQSFFMGEEGRKRLFSEMPLAATEAILNHTEDWTLVETGKRMNSLIKDYTCIMYKQERLGKNLQGVEKILLKYREKPKGIYMKWLDGPWTGRELLYNEALFGAGKVRVREKGALGIIAMTIPADWEIAKRGSNHTCTEIGMKYLLFMIENDYRKVIAKGQLQRKSEGMVEVDGVKVYKEESWMPRDKKLGYYCYHMTHYLDFLRSLEIKAEVYNWDDELQESYYYTEIKLNSGLTDKDFDPANPEYKLK